jgi:hypothetical protein
MPLSASAVNPIVQTNYTADPAPMVYKDTVFVYTSHDEDKTVRNFFTMNDWRCYSTTDMVNWTDRGTPLSYKEFSWSRGDAWAGQCVPRNGKFYYYLPVNKKNGGNAIGVAVADRPTGPFKDALGLPLLEGYGYIDPTVFIDDDGQAYLYWGNPHLCYVKLNPDMVSYDKNLGVVKVPLTDEAFRYRTIHAKETFSWASSIDGLQAHSVRGANNAYCWYVSVVDKATGKKGIAVGVGDRAIGPFKDVLGRPLIADHCESASLNPTVIVDADRQSYLTWGDTALWCVRLNPDGISFDATMGITRVPAEKKEAFAAKIRSTENSTEKRATTYEEGPWLFKRSGTYYLLYPAGGVPEHLAYSTSKTPTGPWVYGDTIMPVIGEGGAFTNHPGYVTYKGSSYLFYHNAGLPGGGGFKRSVCIEPFRFNADGSIPTMLSTKAGVVQSVRPLNPYQRTEAETMAWEEGIETASTDNGGMVVNSIDNGDFIQVKSVDFQKGPRSFTAMVASATAGASIELRLDSKEGPVVATVAVPSTGSDQKWVAVSSKVGKVTGVHDLFLCFKAPQGSTFLFDWWKFASKR